MELGFIITLILSFVIGISFGFGYIFGYNKAERYYDKLTNELIVKYNRIKR